MTIYGYARVSTDDAFGPDVPGGRQLLAAGAVLREIMAQPERLICN
jgi:hypothetical protein